MPSKSVVAEIGEEADNLEILVVDDHPLTRLASREVLIRSVWSIKISPYPTTPLQIGSGATRLGQAIDLGETAEGTTSGSERPQAKPSPEAASRSSGPRVGRPRALCNSVPLTLPSPVQAFQPFDAG
jgi:hypothetical protein